MSNLFTRAFLDLKQWLYKFTIRGVTEELLVRQTHANYRLLTASIINKQAFQTYKGMFKGKNVVLVAAGPTVSDFSPIENAVYVGCNRAFLSKNILFDFLFSIDKTGIEHCYKEFFEYRKGKCIKFVGDHDLGKNWQIPESVIPSNDDKIFRYITDAGMLSPFLDHFPLDISIAPLHNSSTVSIQAMQFILYTQPEKIYIVGVDCTCATQKHFTGKEMDLSFRHEDVAWNDKTAIKAYRTLKEFTQTYYPQTKIISVNPVGLRGIFEDVYTKSFIEKNPNIAKQLGQHLQYLS